MNEKDINLIITFAHLLQQEIQEEEILQHELEMSEARSKLNSG